MKGVPVTIIDDDASARSLLASILRMNGHYNICSLSERNESLRTLDGLRPGVVFLDIEMPGQDGFRFLSRIKASHPDCFVVMVSAHSSLDNVKKAIELGADGFIAKPFSTGKITDIMTKYLDASAGGASAGV